MSLVCNLKEAKRFLNMLSVSPDDTSFQFTLIHEIPDKDGNKKIIQQKGKLSAIEDTLCDLNERKYGIYVTVNQTKSVKRTAADITLCRAVWHDDDGGATIPELEPSITVETSPGKYHRYWLIEGGTTDFDTWKAFMKRFAVKYNSDKSATDLARVMRLPGFYHQKAEPHEVHIIGNVTTSNVKRYTFEEILCMAPEATPPHLGVDDSESDTDEFSLAKAIANITSGNDYHESLNGIAMSYVNRGYSNVDTIATLSSLMCLAPDKGTPRWQARYTDIKRTVITAREKIEREYEDDCDVSENYVIRSEYDSIQITLPPGNMGKLTCAVNSMMRYPSIELSIQGALHAVNTFAGNYYTFDGVPNHRKTVILARQGRGKNTISRFMNKAVHGMISLHPNAALFINYIGSPDFTSAKNIHLELQEWGSRSIITPEAGHAKATQAGDLARLIAYENQLLSSPPGDLINPVKQNTSRGDTRPRKLSAVCVSLIQESVPDNYAILLAGGLQYSDGTISRTNFVFVSDEEEEINTQYNQALDNELLELLYTIADMNATKGDVTHKSVYPDMYEVECVPEAVALFNKLEREYLLKKNKAKDNPVEEAVYTRKIVKIKATSRLLAVADNPIRPKITLEHAEWAIHHQDIIDSELLQQVDRGVLATAQERYIERFAQCVQQIQKDIKANAKATYQGNYDINTNIASKTFLTHIIKFKVGKKHHKDLLSSSALKYRRENDIVPEILSMLENAGVISLLEKESKWTRKNKGRPKTEYRVHIRNKV